MLALAEIALRGLPRAEDTRETAVPYRGVLVLLAVLLALIVALLVFGSSLGSCGRKHPHGRAQAAPPASQNLLLGAA